MADTITLTRGTTAIDIEGPAYPGEPGDRLDQTPLVTIGGRVVTVKTSDDVQVRPVYTWELLDDADYTRLRDFVYNTLDGSTHSFTLTDLDDTDHDDMHYLSGLPGRQVEGGYWEVSLELYQGT